MLAETWSGGTEASIAMFKAIISKMLPVTVLFNLTVGYSIELNSLVLICSQVHML